MSPLIDDASLFAEMDATCIAANPSRQTITPVVDHPAFGHAGSIAALAAEKGYSDALSCMPYDPNEDDWLVPHCS